MHALLFLYRFQYFTSKRKLIHPKSCVSSSLSFLDCSSSCNQPPCFPGVFAKQLNWEYAPQGPITVGREVPLSIDATAVVESDKNIEGRGLWSVNLFGSRSPTGDGEKVGLKEMILSRAQEDLPLISGAGLQFDAMEAEFDVGSVGCTGEVDHLCLEYGRGVEPNPIFYFFTDSGADTLITCKRIQCGAGENKFLLGSIFVRQCVIVCPKMLSKSSQTKWSIFCDKMVHVL